ncbi:hypothetical protein GNZ01_06490 [Escherichia coli]|uniref:Deoxynucleotide monophosphate kinase n=2 Tax=root TaxID=1 RepID=A0AAJ2Y2Q4_ECOLX|nr:hypothetical protein [Escherichia coli]YP_009102137.1 deoxynucleotide monophosphate kinase [Escherichia phage 121Q]MED6562071.1 hypothetical protein [Escherichia coli O157]AIT14440.1 deoxynucleotide monophosphate kinase [Escherichia phage 121Q]EGE6126651.1 hypothetical protein [Escherichia coli]EHV4442776.1 hypothetical protein [Escherichia coli]MCU6292729.1 hypothetical protein [Escherichia coli]
MGRQIIAINGTIGSGKDTFGESFINNGYTRMSFATNLKDSVAAIFGWDREMLEGSTKESRKIREEPDQYWCDKLGRNDVSPRWVLQNYGTNILRKYFHNDIWVFSLEKSMQDIDGNIIITDCRFPNELKMIRSNNGTIIEVQRVLPHWYGLAASYNKGDINIKPVELESVHESEWAWIGINNPDIIVQNNSTIDDLHKKAMDIIYSNT